MPKPTRRQAKPATPAPPSPWPQVLAAFIVTAGKTIDGAVQVVPWVVGALCAIPVSANLAGRDTRASLAVSGLDFLGSGLIGDVLPWLLFGGAVVWALRERRLRQRVIGRFGDTRRQLEEKFDPERTSSGLTETGQTPKEDR